MDLGEVAAAHLVADLEALVSREMHERETLVPEPAAPRRDSGVRALVLYASEDTDDDFECA